MKRRSLFLGALAGVLTSLPVMGLSYLAQQAAGLTFLPFLLFEWLARVLPGGVVTAGIDAMVRFIVALGQGPIDVAAKRLEQATGIVAALVLAALAGLLMALLLRRSRSVGGQRLGALLGFIVAVAVLAMDLAVAGQGGNFQWMVAWVLVLLTGWGVLLGVTVERLMQPPPKAATAPPAFGAASRRDFLAWVAGGSLVVAAAAWGAGRLVGTRTVATGAGQALAGLEPDTAATPSAAGGTAAPAAAATPAPPSRSLSPAPGTRPEVTPNSDFYRIDINALPPRIMGSDWQLHVSGLFDRPRNLTLDDLMAMPAVTQPITLSCISNPIGGDLISTSYWTGVRLKDVLAEMGMQPAAGALSIRGADGFFESVVMEDMLDPRVLLVYGMNGDTLPVEHGFPLRIYIPNRYGMKQPKWITSIEAVDSSQPGYWVVRGWDAQARPKILSIIDTVDSSGAGGSVPVGGIAWAGDRGIAKVEVQVDDGPWNEAQLLAPPLGPLTWVLWRYDWPAAPGTHTFRVRAVDGTGAMQIAEPSDPHPSGATGYHSVTMSI